MKDFTTEKWKESLARMEWERLARTENVEEMTENFTNVITEALDECAPLMEYKINTNYKHGLTRETKEPIKKRDELMKNIKRSPNERKTLLPSTRNSGIESQTTSEGTRFNKTERG